MLAEGIEPSRITFRKGSRYPLRHTNMDILHQKEYLSSEKLALSGGVEPTNLQVRSPKPKSVSESI